MATSRGVGLLMFALMGGCVPSKEAKSAGQIGCTPGEITISNEDSHFGFVQSGKTWVAECHGRTFVCSQVNESGSDRDFFDALFASDQVSCREAPEPLQAERNRQAREAAIAERSMRPPAPPPSGAAGFEFGETPEAAARRCEAAGQAWVSANGRATCSGAAAPLGIPARVDLEFCDGRACAISVEHVPEATWSRSSVSLKANLETKYGPAQESSGSVPERCRTEDAFTQCLASRQVALRYAWRWAGGESLEMSVGKPTPARSAAIRIVYRRPAGAANLSAL